MGDKVLRIKKQYADFGQTLGHYGIGHGISLVLPIFGPSSVRDGIGLATYQFMHPLTYVRNSELIRREFVIKSQRVSMGRLMRRLGFKDYF